MSAQPVEMMEVWGSVIHLSFLLQREFSLTLSPLAHFLLLLNLSNCHLCAVSQWDHQSISVFHKWQESQPPTAFHFFLVSSPAITKA